ncbi:XRE family transcriptional regulator [Sphingomonas ginkgonis]|uniref:XRE family transcriptional regulator n=1 Tax=Sphingomonas ginkgonis TaxID=2315330 RepID=A0A429V801_9SPHN|nr:helix-turn-helix transcriptional regulator [Sphingomonas ginkgonis]RST30022.1 XRE family transcriptional regulator [Sphingomonas ginkgonis]
MNRAERVGARIKRFRELAGLSKSELARRVGVSPTAVNNWEDQGVMPRMEVVLRLEKVLEVDWMQLMSARSDDNVSAPFAADAPAPGQPEPSRRERLDRYRREIADLFDVAPEQVDIVIRH